MGRTSAVAFVVLACGLATPAFAERPRDVMVFEQVPQVSGAVPYNTIFLNRCTGGCVVHPGNTNSTTNTSSIVQSTSTLGAFPYTDAVWNSVVACMKDTFSPFNVNITDVDPGTANHFEIMIGNLPADIGLPGTYGGVSPFACGSSYIPNSLVFDFAGVWNNPSTGSVEDICSTAAQEIAHSFTLDHSTVAADPMTYFSFVGRRYFQNMNQQCGSDCVNGKSPTGLTCSGTNNQFHSCICTGQADQNPVTTITALFGAGTVVPPVVTITNPKFGASVAPGFNVTATISDPNMAAITMAQLTVDGMLVPPNLTTPPYAFSAPQTLGNGVHHVQVTGTNAHGSTGTMTIDVNIGPPCTKPADCPASTDTCIGGRCVPGPGVQGGLGMPCTDGSMCAEGECASDGTNMYCVSSCTKGECPPNFGCLPIASGSDGSGVCWPGYDDGSGGGCNVGAGGSISFGLVFAAYALTRRPRNGERRA